MKLILDLDQSTIENMQGYCSQNNISVNELIENLFNKYIQEPSNIIDDLAGNSELNKLNEFAEMLTYYLNEAIYDIQESANSEESYKTDLPMVEVFKVLNRDHVQNAFILTSLYKVYEDVTKNE